MEAAPGNRYIIRIALVVEVTVTTILKVAVVNPDVCCTIEAEVVPAVTVVCTRSLESEVTHDDIGGTTLEI